MNIQHNPLSKAIRESLFRGTLWASMLALALASANLSAQEADDADEESDDVEWALE